MFWDDQIMLIKLAVCDCRPTFRYIQWRLTPSPGHGGGIGTVMTAISLWLSVRN